MKELKLISILKTFSFDEIKDFEKFIISPFHNNGRNYIPFYKFLKKLHPEYPPEKISAKNVYKKLYRGKIFDARKSSLTIRVLFSQMAQMAEEFLLIKEFYRDDNLPLRNNIKFKANFKNKQLTRFAEKPLLENIRYFNDQIESYAESSFHVITNENLVDLKILNSDYDEVLKLREQNILYSLNSAVDLMYLITAGDLALRQRINKRIKGVEFYKNLVNSIDPEFIEEKIYDDGKGTKSILLLNYYICRYIINNDFSDKEIADRLIKLYTEIFKKLNFELRHSYYVRISNILILGSHVDTEYYGYKAHLLSDYILKNKCYSVNKGEFLSGIGYMNIFVNKEYFLNADEIKCFIDDNIKYVVPESRNYAEKISRVCYSIKAGEFSEGLKILSRINTNETLYKVIISRYKLMLLYELNMYEELISFMDTFEHFLRNNKLLNDFMRDMYMEFIKALKVMLKIKFNSSDKLIDDLENAVNNCRNKVFYPWVKEKSVELLNLNK